MKIHDENGSQGGSLVFPYTRGSVSLCTIS
jgi:hypothetical protein